MKNLKIKNIVLILLFTFLLLLLLRFLCNYSHLLCLHIAAMSSIWLALIYRCSRCYLNIFVQFATKRNSLTNTVNKSASRFHCFPSLVIGHQRELINKLFTTLFVVKIILCLLTYVKNVNLSTQKCVCAVK